MIIAIQQPEHLPWLGFFDKMRNCDKYVFLDNVQFKKRYFENRNKILTANGPQWITVPVKSKGRFTQKINEALIDNTANWRRKYLERIRLAYGSTKKFVFFFPQLEGIITKGHELILDLNIELINCIKNFFMINTPCIRASELVAEDITGSDLILALCKAMQADQYISGPDGMNYLELEEFQSAGIKVMYHDYDHPVYMQNQGGKFMSHLSAVDYIFNHGEGL